MRGGLHNPRVVDATPVNGNLNNAISSDWAYDHAADLDAHTVNPFEQFVVGNYICPTMAGMLNSNFILVQYTLYAFPIIIARDMTFDRAATHIEVQDAGKNIRLGIYNSTDLAPSTLVSDFGVVPTDGGVGTKEIVLGSDLVLTKGYYFLTMITDSNGVASVPFLYGILGLLFSNLGLILGLFEYFNVGYSVAAGAAQFAALPDPFTAGAASQHSMPFMAIRLKSLD